MADQSHEDEPQDNTGTGAEISTEKDVGYLSFLSDIPGDPGSQLPYQEFPPYYLDPT